MTTQCQPCPINRHTHTMRLVVLSFAVWIVAEFVLGSYYGHLLLSVYAGGLTAYCWLIDIRSIDSADSVSISAVAILEPAHVVLFNTVREPVTGVKKRCIVCDKVRSGFPCARGCINKWTCTQCTEQWSFYNPRNPTWPCCNLPRAEGTEWECVVRRWSMVFREDEDYMSSVPKIRMHRKRVLNTL